MCIHRVLDAVVFSILFILIGMIISIYTISISFPYEVCLDGHVYYRKIGSIAIRLDDLGVPIKCE